VLHEAAHYAVHSLYAESVSFGVNRYGPYVDAVHDLYLFHGRSIFPNWIRP